MAREGVVYQVPDGIPEPYRGYIMERNGKVARKIAEVLGVSFLGLHDGEIKCGRYLVPARTLDKKIVGDLTSDSFYGAVVDDLRIVGKTVLHPRVGEKEEFDGLVLPGYSVFTQEELEGACEILANEGLELRLKKPMESDGAGQTVICGSRGTFDVEIGPEGLVVEPNLHGQRTISVGCVRLKEREFSFLAHQKNDRDPVDGRDRYLGADVTVVQGNIEELAGRLKGEEKNVAMKVARFDRDYRKRFGVVCSRISYDYLLGKIQKGDEIGGITDITARLGGTCPALVEAIPELLSGAMRVEAEVNLNYQPESIRDFETDATRYVDTNTLRLTSRVKRKL